MLELGRVYTHPRTAATGRVIESAHERSVVERTMPPGTGRADPHVHHDFDQRFEVVSGSATARVGKEKRTLAAGEALELPRGVPHVDPYNAGTEDLVVRNVVSPAPRFVHVYFASWGRALEDGRLNDQNEFTFLGLMTTLAEARGDSWAAGPPQRLQKLMLPAGGALGRRRGHRAYES
jgi:mannose-6-phosphate isomerase-like protein (cupin superfamily)